MERVRLIYEQIEEAKKYILAGSLLQLRLALILLDNAVELMTYRELQEDFAFHDWWRPKYQPALEITHSKPLREGCVLVAGTLNNFSRLALN